jgi:hypothetical protein
MNHVKALDVSEANLIKSHDVRDELGTRSKLV